MKKLSFIYAAFILLLTVVACNSKSSSDGKDQSSEKLTFSTAIEYNDFIIGQQEKVIKAVLKLSDVMNANPINNNDLKANYNVFGKECKKALDTIKKMDSYNNNTGFRDESIRLFQFYYDIYEKDYKELIDIIVKGDKITEADATRMLQIQESITKRENKRDGKFAAEQNKFASENNMQIIQNDLQKEIDKKN